VQHLPDLLSFGVKLRKDASHDGFLLFSHCQGGAVAPEEIQGKSSFEEPKLGVGHLKCLALLLETTAKLFEAAAILLDGPDKGVSLFFQKVQPPAHRCGLPLQQQELFPSNGKRHP
jgi:hypothetical protein